METLDNMMREYREKRSRLTQQELAQYEAQIWGLFSVGRPDKPERRAWFVENFGGSQSEYELRASMAALGPMAQPVWDRVHGGMSLYTGTKLLRKAKQLTAERRWSTVGEALEAVIKEFDSTGHEVVLSSGKLTRRSNPNSNPRPVDKEPEDTRELRQALRALITQFHDKYAAGLDEYQAKMVKEEYLGWVNDGTDTYARQLYKLRTGAKEEKMYRIGKTRFETALQVLGMQGIFGKPIDLKTAKKLHNRVIVMKHPDKHGGSPEMAAEVQRVNEAYSLLKHYNEQLKETA